jgi:hypothetical protein
LVPPLLLLLQLIHRRLVLLLLLLLLVLLRLYVLPLVGSVLVQAVGRFPFAACTPTQNTQLSVTNENRSTEPARYLPLAPRSDSNSLIRGARSPTSRLCAAFCSSCVAEVAVSSWEWSSKGRINTA